MSWQLQSAFSSDLEACSSARGAANSLEFLCNYDEENERIVYWMYKMKSYSRVLRIYKALKIATYAWNRHKGIGKRNRNLIIDFFNIVKRHFLTSQGLPANINVTHTTV